MDVKNFSMEIFKRYCRLCGHITSNDNFSIIDDVMKHIFRVLLPKLTFDNETQSVICKVCSSKVLAAFNFKSTCIDTENSILPFIDFESSTLVDLKEVYANEKGNDQANSMLEALKICRLCLQPIRGEHWSLDEVLFDNVQILIPEINFKVTADAAFCSHCMDSLSVHSTFLKRCSDLQPEINLKENGVGDTLLIDSRIKKEEIEIKCEDIEEPRYTPSPIPHGIKDIKIESEDSLEDSKETSTVHSAVPNYKDPLEVRMYRCTSCAYETKYKGNFKVHLSRRHKDPSEVQTYKCVLCSYKTKHREDLKAHLLRRHIDPSVGMHSCDRCEYKCKFRSGLRKHMSVHQDPFEMRTYVCDKCEYRSNYETTFRRHQSEHKHPSEVPAYTCDECGFETKHKNSLKRHRLTHADRPDVPVYKCDQCRYKTKRKNWLECHTLTHKNPSGVPMYKCDECEYATKYNYYLKEHVLTHKGPSEGPVHECDKCKYKTANKRNLKRHKFVHETS